MPKRLDPIIYRDWSGGLTDSVSNYLMPDNRLKFLLNAYTDESGDNEYGNIKGRGGYTILGSQIIEGKDCLGLYDFNNAAGTVRYPICFFNTQGDGVARSYYLNSSTWTQIGTNYSVWEPSIDINCETFLNYVFAANGYQTIKTWNGVPATNWGTTNAVGAPIGSLIVNFYDRVNISGVFGYRSRIYYSSLPDSATNEITWDTENDYFDLNPDDNDEIVGFSKNSGLLIIFKRKGIYTWNGDIETQADKIYDIGAVNQKCIQEIRGITFFVGETYNDIGIFIFKGEQPIEISREIRKWINVVPSTNYNKISSFKDEDNYYCSVGSVTYEGIDYTGVVFKYCVSKGTWAVYSSYNEIKRGTIRIDSTGTRTIIIGDDNGQIHTGTGFTDNGNPIYSIIRTKELEFGTKAIEKTIEQIIAYSDNYKSYSASGASIKVRIEGGKWINLGSLDKPIKIIDCNLKGRYFEFEISYANSGVEPFTFGGFEFSKVILGDYDK